jgi:pentose-5-phosphate-3-epimerase
LLKRRRKDRRRGALVFDIVEIEDGKRLKSTEIRSLIDGGTTLKRVRKTEKAGAQTLVYVRQ